MYMVLFLFYIIFFFNASFGMSDNNQRFCLVPLVSDQEYNNSVYPISRAQRTEFEAARKELQTIPDSQAAQKRLNALADQGYIPALYPLISNEIQRGNLLQALELSYKGACAADSDPTCALTLASLYAQPSDTEDEEQQNIRKLAMEAWLYSASTKRVMYDNNKKVAVSGYVNNTAKDYLNTYLQEHQEENEVRFLKYSDEQLNKSEKDILAGDLVDNSLACFLIKKHISTNSGESKKRAVGLAEKIVNAPTFYAEQLHASGVKTALEGLNNEQIPARIKARLSQLLATWDQKEICVSQLVQAHEEKQPKPKFVTPDYSAEVLQELIDKASDNFEGVDLIEAALYLYLHRAKDSRVSQAVNSCLERTLQDPDPTVRRALIERCTGDLLPFAEKAMNKYATELQAHAGLLQEEADFMNAHLQGMMKKADAGDDEAAMRIYDLLINHGDCFSCIPAEKKKSVQDKYFKQAFTAGNYTAVCMGLPTARAMNPQTGTELVQAMRFWSQAYKSSIKNHGIAQTPIPESLEKESYEKVIELRNLKIERNIPIDDPEFFYELTYVLARQDPKLAREAFCKAIEVAALQKNKIPEKQLLYEATGVKLLLENLGKEGKGWAQFAQACALVVAMRNAKCVTTVDCVTAIRTIETARSLLKEAANAKEPFRNDSLLNEVALDISKGVHYYLMFQIDRSKRLYLQNALELLKGALAKGHSQAPFELAQIILQGDDQKGQRALELAIDYMIRSTNQNNSTAHKGLQEIAQDGLAYVASCEGSITLELKKKIDACLESKRKQQEGVPVGTVSTIIDQMNPKEEYEIIKQHADQGNIEAKVSVAMMLRDGNGVERSVEQSQEYFTQALLEWNGKTNIPVLGVAHAALADASEQDIRVKAARAKYQVHDIVVKMGAKAFTEQQLDEKLSVLNNDIQHIMEARKGTDSNNQLFYTSGLAQLIKDKITILETQDVFLYNLLNTYMQRLQAFPEEIQDNKKASLLAVPVKAIIVRSHGLLQIDVGAVTMSQEEEAAHKRALESLNAVIKKDIWISNKEQLEYLKALMLIMKSINGSAKYHVEHNRIANAVKHIESTEKKKDAILQIGGDLLAIFTAEMKNSYSEASALLNALSKRKYTDAVYMQGYLAVHGNALNPCIARENMRGMALLEELSKQKHVNALFTLIKIYNEELKKTNKPSERLSHAKKMEKYLTTIVSMDPENQFALTLLMGVYVDNPQVRPSSLPEGSSEKECVDHILGLLPKVEFTQPVKDICSMILRIRKNEMSLDLLAHIQHCLTLCESVNLEVDKAWQALEEHYALKDFSKKFDQWTVDYTEQEKTKKRPNRQLISQIYTVNQWLHTLIARSFTIRMKIEKDYPALKSKIQKEAEEKAYNCYKKSAEYHSALAYLLMSGLELMGSKQVSPDQRFQQAQNYIEQAMKEMEKQGLNKENVPLFEASLNDYLVCAKNFLPEKYMQAQAFVDKYKEQFA